MDKLENKCLVLKAFSPKEKNTHLEHLEDDIINRGFTRWRQRSKFP